MAETMDPSAGEFVIEGLGAAGDGVAKTSDGLTVYLKGALPGERVAVGSDKVVREILGHPSPDRRQSALCPHFPACGGCTVQHMDEALYARWKAGLLQTVLGQHGLAVEPQPMRSVPRHSRRRATFGGRRTPGGFALGFHVEASHDIVPMRDCAILAKEIVAALPLLARIAEIAAPRNGDVRLSVLATMAGLDLTLSSGRDKSDGKLLADLADLARQGRVARITLNGAPVFMAASPTVALSGVPVRPPPAAFLQAVAEADEMMGELVGNAIPARSKGVADLFAGLGTFTFALARKAAVTAFDSDKRLLAALADGARHGKGLKPILTTPRDLFTDPLSAMELNKFDAVVLDPPRAGAKGQAEALARSRVKRVVAVSCNPATLARDLRIMTDGGMRIDAITPVDQFLYTPHLEVVAVLSR